MSRRPTVYLFDVDGTLIVTGGAGRRAMRRAFEEVVGHPDALEGIKLGGMTDRLILRRGLEVAGHPFEEAMIEALLERYLARLDEELPNATGYRVLDGVLGALEFVEGLDDVAIGLGTGNIELGARAKLRRGELDHRFAFGGFGSDAEDRVALLEAGAERGAALLGRPLDAVRIVVVGDTPRDIDAAEGLGAEIVAVATGGFDAHALRTAGAPTVYARLDEAAALDALGG